MAPVNYFAARTVLRSGAVVGLILLANFPVIPSAVAQQMETHRHEDGTISPLPSARMIMHMIRNPMLPGLSGARPSVSEFLPGQGIDAATLPMAGPREIVDLANGDTLALEATLVRKMVAGKKFVMYAFNGQIPGPLIRVQKGSEIHVRFTNNIDMETTVHWHGLRLDNRFDGVPGLTQDPVQPGARVTPLAQHSLFQQMPM